MNCKECGKLIGHVENRWIIIYVLHGRNLCESCWNEISEFNE